jgi:hypothetical protein
MSQVTDALRNAVASTARRWILGVTLLLGVLGAVGILLGGEPADRTFAGLCGTAQLLMSVTLPFTGVLLARDLRLSGGRRRPAPMLTAAMALAVGVGLAGDVICAIALAFASAGARWEHAGLVALQSLLVQLVAQAVGTGLGLLIRPAVVACLATIVLPLGLWLILGLVPFLRPAQVWLTPFAAVQNLLAGPMSAIEWAQWLVVALLWGAGLNAVGLARGKRTG